MKPLGIRSRLLLLVTGALTAVLVVVVLVFNIVLDRSLLRNADERARARAATALTQTRVADGRLSVRDGPETGGPDTYAWVFAAGRMLEAPSATQALTADARALRGTEPRFKNVAGTRLYATPIIDNGRRLGTVVSGVSLEPYEDSRRTALIGSLVLAGTVLLAVAVATRMMLAASLRPVARMTAQAEQWSELDVGSRFDLGAPYDELTQLAATLDRLLDRLETSLLHEQRFSAELSHELRTPLARLLTSTEIALRRDRTPVEYREALEDVHRAASSLTRTVDALVAAARLEAGGKRGTCDAYAVATHATEACAILAAEHGVDLGVKSPPHPIRVGIELELAERILQPVVENACRHARTSVNVSIDRNGPGVVYAVEDDGPGVDVEDRDRIFDPGVRGKAPRGGGAGLGLALSRRLARSANGDVVLADGRFVIRLPPA